MRKVETESGLDGVDVLILRALEADPRAPLAALGRAAGVSDSTAGRRLDRLRNDGLVELYAIRQPFPPGSTAAIIGLLVDPARLTSVADTLARDPRFRYVGLCTGEFDVIIEGSFSDNNELANFLEVQAARIEGVKGLRTFVVISLLKFLSHGLVAGSRAKADPEPSPEPQRVALGEVRIGVY